MINYKGFGRKRSWSIFKILSRHSSVHTEENHKNLVQKSQYSGQDFVGVSGDSGSNNSVSSVCHYSTLLYELQLGL
jgi:hypothetical protein